MTENRRTSTRYAVSIDCSVKLDSEEVAAQITNISLGGAQLATVDRLSIGTRMTVRFQIPTHEQPIEVGAAVRWGTDDSVGVQFDGLRAREVWSLNKYFESLSP